MDGGHGERAREWARGARDGSVTGEELVVVELGERDGDGAGALAGAGGAALVGLHAGEAAGEAGAARAPVLPRLLPALLAWGTLIPAAAGAVGGGGAGGRALRGRLPLHGGLGLGRGGEEVGAERGLGIWIGR